MDTEQINTRIVPLLRKYWLPLILSVLGMIFLVYGLISLFVSDPKEAVNFSRDTSQASQASNSENVIVIDIEGAVVAPGVYRLKFGSIIQEGLIAAKGLADLADREYVARNINLAQKLSDGQKIYIPFVSDKKDSEASLINDGLIDINHATLGELDSLVGIGQVTAQKIINNRPYSAVNDLLTKKVVSDRVFNGIKDRITAL